MVFNLPVIIGKGAVIMFLILGWGPGVRNHPSSPGFP